MKELLKQIKEKYPNSYVNIQCQVTQFKDSKIEIQYSFYSKIDVNKTSEANHIYFNSAIDLKEYITRFLNGNITPDTIEQAEKLMQEIEG